MNETTQRTEQTIPVNVILDTIKKIIADPLYHYVFSDLIDAVEGAASAVVVTKCRLYRLHGSIGGGDLCDATAVKVQELNDLLLDPKSFNEFLSRNAEVDSVKKIRDSQNLTIKSDIALMMLTQSWHAEIRKSSAYAAFGIRGKATQSHEVFKLMKDVMLVYLLPLQYDKVMREAIRDIKFHSNTIEYYEYLHATFLYWERKAKEKFSEQFNAFISDITTGLTGFPCSRKRREKLDKIITALQSLDGAPRHNFVTIVGHLTHMPLALYKKSLEAIAGRSVMEHVQRTINDMED